MPVLSSLVYRWGVNESPVALQERLPVPALRALTHTCAAEAFLGWPGSPPTVEG